MKRMRRNPIVLALVGAVAAIGVSACAAAPRGRAEAKAPAGSLAPGIRPAADLTPEEEMLIQDVLHRMLDAMSPESGSEPLSRDAKDDFALTVKVYVYDQRHYDAAVEIVKSLTRGRRIDRAGT